MIINNNKNGFSLIELTFALMITGMGILAIFHVFPSGLDAGKNAVADTRAMEFAQSVFESYRYEIAKILPSKWDPDSLDITVSIPCGNGGTEDNDYIEISPVDKFQDPTKQDGEDDAPIPFPVGSDPTEYIRYKLKTELLSDNLVGIYLEVSYGRMSNHKKAFYTAIYYREM